MDDRSRTHLNPDGPVPKHNAQTGYTAMPAGTVLLDRYEIKSVLGRGGMGTVYRVHDRLADIDLALKAIPPELSNDRAGMENVRSNFQLVHKLHHPNIANLNTLERDPESGGFYLLLECVLGEDLRAFRMRHEGRQPLRFWFPVLRQLAAALDYAHERGIIHRDIKPSNVFICEDGSVKILDFGIASKARRSINHANRKTAEISGTASYMAPEQWQGSAQGAATDQYALAATTYQLIAGRSPFEGEHLGALRDAVLQKDAPRPAGLSDPVWSVLERGLAKDPTARFDSCSGFVRALEQAAAQRPRHTFYKRFLAAALGTLALALAAFLVWQKVSPNATAPQASDILDATTTTISPTIKPAEASTPEDTTATTAETVSVTPPRSPPEPAEPARETKPEPTFNPADLESWRATVATAKAEALASEAQRWAPIEWNQAEQKRIEANTAFELERYERAASGFESAASFYRAAKVKSTEARKLSSETTAAAAQKAHLAQQQRRRELETRIDVLAPRLSEAESSLENLPTVWAPLEQDWRNARAAFGENDLAAATRALERVESRLETTAPLLARLADQRTQSEQEKQRLIALAAKARETLPLARPPATPADPPFLPIGQTSTSSPAPPLTETVSAPQNFAQPAPRPVANQPATLALSLRLPAGITGNISGEVLVDGQSKGRMTFPARVSGLSAGNRLVELRGLDRLAQPAPVRIPLQSGVVTTRTIPLEWAPSYFAFEVKPANASIKLVDTTGRQIPMQRGRTRVAPGARYEIQATADGFKSKRMTIISTPGETKRIQLQLERGRAVKFRS